MSVGFLMIVSVKGKIENMASRSFGNGEEKKAPDPKDTLLKNNFSTNTKIAYDKIANAFTIYPAQGLKGNKNSNFYEFLTMGIVPYLIGSVTLMSVFNSANKHFDAFSKLKATSFGKKMALGVLFYGIAKEMSKTLVTAPVKIATGVDVNLPYSRVIYNLPESKFDTDLTKIESHKVFESVEFPRFDLLYGDENKGEKRNAYYDKIAKKLGLGENLQDSDQEVKPRIKQIVTKTSAVTSVVSYLWAATAVAFAFQKPWEDFFKGATAKFWKLEPFKNTVKNFGKTCVRATKSLYNGEKTEGKFARHSGKALIFTSLLATVVGDIISIHGKSKPAKLSAEKVIKKDRKYVVS